MFRVFFLSLFFYQLSFSLSVSSNDDYKIYKDDKFKIIYTDDFKDEANFLKENLDDFLSYQDKSFGYTFDEPLTISLISNNIQLANAFSTPIPFNQGLYYNGGSGMSDYFATSSWLKTLLIHETTHNYQLNAKKSEISQTLHKYLGNNYLPIIAGLPFFTIPNYYLPSAYLEGNSVLQESLYDNGGRLYNGSFNALKNSIVLGNNIDIKRFINDHDHFPYGTEKYIVGGFYMQYMASMYGIDKVNQFFYENSIHSINPFLLDETFQEHFKISYEESFNNFIKYTKEKYKSYNEVPNEDSISSSKDLVYFSKKDDKVVFITTDLTSNKTLNSFNLNSKELKKEDTKLDNGKVFLIDDILYSSSSGFISSTMYKAGLFSSCGYIKDGTMGKDVKDIYQDKMAYIDIKKSFSFSKLYINDEFYNTVSSDTIFDKDGNIYYFKQDKNIRTLYKNKTALYSFEGYYSKPIDITSDGIYFISNTKNGSSIYLYKENKTYKVSNYDNIIDGKIINKNQAIVSSISNDKVSVNVVNLKLEESAPIVYENVKQKEPFNFKEQTTANIDGKDYNALKELKFSMLYPYFSYSSDKGSQYMATALFFDPLMFNMLNIYALKDYDESSAGISYTNERYIPFNINVYDKKRDEPYSNERGWGGSIEVYGPLVKKGRHSLDVSLKQYFDDKNKDKAPTVLGLNYIYKEKFPQALSFEQLNDTKLYVKQDRGDFIYNLDYNLNKHLLEEFYIDAQFNYVKSDTQNLTNQKGIEVVTKATDMMLDKTNVLAQGFDDSFFVKSLTKYSIGFSKTFHINKYFQSFPLSLRKESLFYKYNYYKIKTSEDIYAQENVVGVNFNTLLIHKMELPIIVQYIHNNEVENNNDKILVTLGLQF